MIDAIHVWRNLFVAEMDAQGVAKLVDVINTTGDADEFSVEITQVLFKFLLGIALRVQRYEYHLGIFRDVGIGFTAFVEQLVEVIHFRQCGGADVRAVGVAKYQECPFILKIGLREWRFIMVP